MSSKREILTASLVYENHRQRFYKLNKYIKIGYNRSSNIKFDISKDTQENNRFKKEYLHLTPIDGVNVICISDAKTHIERLAFAAVYNYIDKIYSIINMRNIEGVHTMMINGGDESKIYPDYVYIRKLAELNNYYFSLKNLN
jgi:hypothetical protein